MVYVHVDDNETLYHELKNNPVSVIKVYSNSCAPCTTMHGPYQELSQRFQFIPFLDVNMRSNLIRVTAVPNNTYYQGRCYCRKDFRCRYRRD